MSFRRWGLLPQIRIKWPGGRQGRKQGEREARKGVQETGERWGGWLGGRLGGRLGGSLGARLRGQRPSQAKEGKTVTTVLCSGLMRKHTLSSATSALNCLTLALSLITEQHDLEISLAPSGPWCHPLQNTGILSQARWHAPLTQCLGAKVGGSL